MAKKVRAARNQVKSRSGSLKLRCDNIPAAILKKASSASTRFVTTDYVLDETATLFKARGLGHRLDLFFSDLAASHACRTLWTGADDFARARDYFLRHKDKDYSLANFAIFCSNKSCVTCYDVTLRQVSKPSTVLPCDPWKD
jgi:hypothetical protein